MNTGKQTDTETQGSEAVTDPSAHIEKERSVLGDPSTELALPRHSLPDTFTHHGFPYLSFLALAQCLKVRGWEKRKCEQRGTLSLEYGDIVASVKRGQR